MEKEGIEINTRKTKIMIIGNHHVEMNIEWQNTKTEQVKKDFKSIKIQ